MARKIIQPIKLLSIIIIGGFLTIILNGCRMVSNTFNFNKLPQKETKILKTANSNILTNLSPEIKKEIVKKEEIKAVSVIQNQDIAQAVQQAVNEVGGIKLTKPESIVLIKPNVNSNGKYPATTNPAVVEKLIKMAQAAGAKRVIVADSSGVGWPDTLKNMARTGLKQVAEQAGAEVVDIEKKGWKEIKPKNSQYWPNGFRFSKIIDEVDYIISVPIIKTHATTGITLGLKNTVGLLHRDDRLFMHKSDKISEMIAEINLAYRPDLIVFDGSKSFVTRGPAVGKEVTGNYIVAGKELLTSDFVAYQVLRKLGAEIDENPLSHPMLNHAKSLGLNFKEVKI